LGHGVAVPLPGTVERFGKPVSASIPTILRAYKSAVTYRINVLRGTPGPSVWQGNYYEHVVRDDKEFWATVNYIRTNPLKWQEDRENPALLSLEKSHS
jgi:REP element-mobilizing transposase RayT